MKSVEWIKISADIFKNRKIDYILSQKNGTDFFAVWIYLLTLAGQINDGGAIYFTANIPYKAVHIARPLGLTPLRVQEALTVFRDLEMIEISSDGIISIKNWERYQNVEGMNKIREQTRKRVAEYRERNAERNADVTQDVTLGNADVTENVTKKDEKEKRTKREKEKEIKNTDIEGEREKRAAAGARYIRPTLEEVKKYVAERGNKISAEKFYDYYESNGWRVGRNAMKDWKAAVRTWEQKEKDVPWYTPRDQKKRESSFETDDFFQAAVAASYKE